LPARNILTSAFQRPKTDAFNKEIPAKPFSPHSRRQSIPPRRHHDSNASDANQYMLAGSETGALDVTTKLVTRHHSSSQVCNPIQLNLCIEIEQRAFT
jgi:hypothetical protein